MFSFRLNSHFTGELSFFTFGLHTHDLTIYCYSISLYHCSRIKIILTCQINACYSQISKESKTNQRIEWRPECAIILSFYIQIRAKLHRIINEMNCRLFLSFPLNGRKHNADYKFLIKKKNSSNKLFSEES